MRMTVTVRHCEISDDLRSRATDVVARLAKVARRLHSAEVIFDADHGTKVVELKFVLARSQVRVATAEADDFRTALDRAADKMRSQLDREIRRPAQRSEPA